ncbi:hypothetical protein AciPR4_3109 [Terriglobus saanensis SP1PR4]|uniref:Uncharacterized protein n=1 Tax=Terriglobus saanensis (strain ATCC BAA-1853 / DSM 23119 / SP1PR4) TaxID=401053 RepID=E8V6R5_TERSS|nr:hypothetical protein AciPR4_3109 [Terriglobus saanensis SP1PR4]
MGSLIDFCCVTPYMDGGRPVTFDQVGQTSNALEFR